MLADQEMQTNTKLKTLTKPIGTSHEKKKTMLTKTTTPLVLKLLAALCMLDCVGTQAIMASGVNCATSSDTRCKLKDPPCKSPGFCFDKTKYTHPVTGEVYLPFQFCKTMPHSHLGMCLKKDMVRAPPT